MNATKRYPPRVQERTIRLVIEQQGEHLSQWAAICSLADLPRRRHPHHRTACFQQTGWAGDLLQWLHAGVRSLGVAASDVEGRLAASVGELAAVVPDFTAALDCCVRCRPCSPSVCSKG